LLIDREIPTPVIHSLTLLPAIIEPCGCMIGIAGLRDGNEIPKLVSGSDIERTRIAWRIPDRHLAIGCTHNNGVLVDKRHSTPIHTGVSKTHLAERRIRLTVA